MSECRNLYSGPQIENHDTVILHEGGISGPQVAVKLRVIFEPPERGPGKDDETRAALPQSFHFPDRCCVVRRWSPVFPVSFEEGESAASRGPIAGRPLILINENEGASTRHGFPDVRLRLGA